MGRSIFSSNNSGLASTSTKLKAAAAFNSNDVVQIIPGGQVTPVRVSDYATVANAGSPIFGYTSAISNAVSQAYNGSLAAQGPDGSIYFLKAGAIDKYAASGSLIQSIAGGAGSTLCNVFFLANGNLCTTGLAVNGAFYAIYNPTGMIQVVAPTALVGASSNSGNLSTIPLVGGGFAALYNSTSTTAATLAIYNNAGVLLNSATMTTSTGSPTPQLSLAQLSDGTIAVAYLNTTYFVAVYNTSAVLQVAPFSTGLSQATGLYNVSCPYLSVLPGCFALAVQSASSTTSCMVFSNAGAQQGPTYSGASAALSYPAYTCSLVNDGTNFWLVYLIATTVNYVKITQAGVAIVYSLLGSAVGSFGGGSAQWSYYDPTTASIVTWFGATAYCVFSTALIIQIVPINTIQTGLSTNAYYSASAGFTSQTGLLMLSDGAFFCYGQSGGGNTYYSLWKSVNTAIVGVATSSAVPGSLVSFFPQAGVYYVNAVKGSGSKTFDHSAANIYGNKGALLTSGIVLKGM